MVSTRRMDRYLRCSEVENYIEHPPLSEKAIEIANTSFTWEFKAPGETIESTALKEINLSIKPGEFIAVVGNVGSGKSSLINALIGNMKPIRLEDESYVNISGK